MRDNRDERSKDQVRLRSITAGVPKKVEAQAKEVEEDWGRIRVHDVSNLERSG
jgi:hypothetical protein